MPVTYQIDSAAGIIRTRCAGIVTFEEIAGHFRELAEDPACPARLDVLLDLTAIESLPDPSQVRSVGAEIDRVRERVRFGSCAIVAGSDAMFGMMRMFEVFAANRFGAIRVLRALDEAESWLASRRP
jgi:hypothetical protein